MPRSQRRVGKGAERRAHVFDRVGFAALSPPYE